jgi:MOSC domain-containing protein YiiM
MESDVRVTAVSRNGDYSFSKPNHDEIVLVAGLGVAGDVHAGATVRHRGRVRADPGQPNLRQVHLIHGELFDELRADGWTVEPGQLGENVTTLGVDLLGLPRGTVLRFGPPPGGGESADGAGTASEAVAGVLAAAEQSKLEPAAAAAVAALSAAVARFSAEEGERDQRAVVAVTGLRNPCLQINGFSDGLLKKVAYADADGQFVRKAGVMGVVLRGGPVRPGDPVAVELPPSPHEALDRV